MAARTQARWLLVAGAALLIATALFHSTGLAMVGGWLPGQKGQILTLLWLTPIADWTVVALLWLWAAKRGRADLRLVVLFSAIVPAFVAIGLFVIAGASHPGGFMLAGSVILAVLGAWRLP